MKMTDLRDNVFFWVRASRARVVVLSFPWLVLAFEVPAQSPAPNLSADELARKTAAHELDAASAPGYYQYCFEENTAHGSETREVVETRNWMIERLVLKNGRALTTAEQQREERRLRSLLTSPARLQAFQREQLSSKERLRAFIAAFPQAFSCQYDDAVQENSPQGFIRLRFHPNPRFVCRSWELRPLQGMEGTLLIEPTAARLARMDARFFRDVDFGGGLVGQIDRGGSFQLEQQPLGDNHWAITTLAMHFNKRVFLANIRVDLVTKTSAFRCVPKDMSLQQGVQRLLEQTPATVALRESKQPR
jgi:hypothetical protein